MKETKFDPSGNFDAAWNTLLTDLFASPEENLSEIDSAMLSLVRFLSAGVILSDETYREDINGEVHIFLMELVRRREFDPSRLSCNGGKVKAFSYFARAGNRQFWRLSKSLQIEASMRTTIPDIDSIFKVPSRPDPPVDAIRRMKNRRSFVILDRRDRATVADCIDESIRRALRAMGGEHNDARLAMAIDAMQQIRMALLGEFRAILLPSLRYTKCRRLVRGDDESGDVSMDG